MNKRTLATFALAGIASAQVLVPVETAGTIILMASHGAVDESEPPPEVSANPCEGVTDTNYHVIPGGGAGSQNGSDWSNAYNALPASLDRGGCYWIGDGTHAAYIFDDATNGTQVIAVAKATETYHGSAVGWSSLFGDGQTIFSDRLSFDTNYYVVDGMRRDESDLWTGWDDEDSYGIVTDAVESGSGFPTENDGAHHVSIRYVAIVPGDNVSSPVAFGINGTNEGWYIGYTLQKNGRDTQLNGASNLVYEYNLHHVLNGKECIRSQTDSLNMVMRYNVFWDCCRNDIVGGDGCTADVALFGNPTASFEGIRYYGNLHRRAISGSKADGTMQVQADDCIIAFNTVYDDEDGGNGGLKCIGTGGSVRNNIAYFPNGMSNNITGTTANNNSTYTSSPPFVNVATGDFHLTDALAGAALGSPYDDEDLDGVVRSTPDRGAYEFN